MRRGVRDVMRAVCYVRRGFRRVVVGRDAVVDGRRLRWRESSRRRMSLA